jgi:hypothetical protein
MYHQNPNPDPRFNNEVQQAIVTDSGRLDLTELGSRKAKDKTSFYPRGNIGAVELSIAQGEPLLTVCLDRDKNELLPVFSSLNGYGSALLSKEQNEENLRFCGFSLNPSYYNITGQNIGNSVHTGNTSNIAFNNGGSFSILITGNKKVCNGDVLMWTIPDPDRPPQFLGKYLASIIPFDPAEHLFNYNFLKKARKENLLEYSKTDTNITPVNQRAHSKEATVKYQNGLLGIALSAIIALARSGIIDIRNVNLHDGEIGEGRERTASDNEELLADANQFDSFCTKLAREFGLIKKTSVEIEDPIMVKVENNHDEYDSITLKELFLRTMIPTNIKDFVASGILSEDQPIPRGTRAEVLHAIENAPKDLIAAERDYNNKQYNKVIGIARTSGQPGEVIDFLAGKFNAT